MSKTITAYKGFNEDMTCRGFHFEIGKEYTQEGKIGVCDNGFHACEYPLDVFGYYSPAQSVFAVVEQSGDISRCENDSKLASEKIKIKASIDLGGLIKAAIEYTTSRAKNVKGSSSRKHQGAAQASGDCGAAQASGTRGAAQASGYLSAAQASGYQGAAQASGYQGAAQASGTRGAAQASGDCGAAQASGYQGAAQASGDCGAAQASGDCGAAQASGDCGAAQASGTRGAAQASGDCGVASGLGYACKARASATGAIVLCHRNKYGEIIHIRASKVGDNGIKPDTWYTLDVSGEFVEAEK